MLLILARELRIKRQVVHLFEAWKFGPSSFFFACFGFRARAEMEKAAQQDRDADALRRKKSGKLCHFSCHLLEYLLLLGRFLNGLLVSSFQGCSHFFLSFFEATFEYLPLLQQLMLELLAADV